MSKIDKAIYYVTVFPAMAERFKDLDKFEKSLETIKELHTITQEMAEALDRMRCYAKWHIVSGAKFHPTLPSAILKSEEALTNWNKYKEQE